MNSSRWLWPILLVACQFCAAQSHAVKIAPSGTTTISAAFGRMKVKAEFRTATVQISIGEASKRKFVQCTYSITPCSLTERVRLQIDGKGVVFPDSAYSDLGDITTAQLTTKAGLVILIIRGGDASEAYIADLMFNRDRLLERRLYSGEDPNHPLEISHYYVVSLGD